MFKKYVENQQLNYHINVFLGKFDDPQVQKNIEDVLPTLPNTNAWYKAWRKLAEESEVKG